MCQHHLCIIQWCDGLLLTGQLVSQWILFVVKAVQVCFLTHFTKCIFKFYRHVRCICGFPQSCGLLLKEQIDICSAFSIMYIYIILILKHYFFVRWHFFSRCFSKHPLKLGVQTTTAPNIISKDTMNCGLIATSSFPHGPLLKSHQNEIISLSNSNMPWLEKFCLL